MKKNFLLIVASLSLFASFQAVRIEAGELGAESMTPAGYNYRVVTSSLQVFNGGGTVYRLELSTGYNSVTDWTQVIDTVGVLATNVYSSFIASTTWATPMYQFLPSTAAVQNRVISFEPYGLHIKNGLYIYIDRQPVSAAGLDIVGVYYRQ